VKQIDKDHRMLHQLRSSPEVESPTRNSTSKAHQASRSKAEFGLHVASAHPYKVEEDKKIDE
jgi:hypothetical protein